MADSTLAKLILSAVQSRDPISGHCCQGVLNASEVRLTIDQDTPIKLPLSPAAFGTLIDASAQAAYGQKSNTIVDTKVRDTLEIDGTHVSLSDDLQAAVESAADETADALGLDHDRLQMELYKLLIYRKGGHFAPHRDSEKRRGMVATMIVVLPNKFGGGDLVIRQSGKEDTFTFGEASRGAAIQYAAFFADCEHQVRRVRSGVRICLAFNLILKPKSRSAPRAKSSADPHVTRALREWSERRPSDPIVIALEHQYTSDGLKPDLLKGTDRKKYHSLSQASALCDYALHLGQVSRHLCQDAHDGSYGYDRYRRRDRYPTDDHEVSIADLHVGEAYEDEIVIDGWKDDRGKRICLPDLPCEASQLISTIPVEDWVPTSQDYEGYTGNAGNTLDRWYHKSAIVLWPRLNSLEIYLKMGVCFAIGCFMVMRKQLFEIPEDDDERLEAACQSCHNAAETMIDRWPERLHDAYVNEDAKALSEFADELVRFDDPDLIVRFLSTLHQRDLFFSLDRFVTSACKRIGADEMTPILLRYLRSDRQPNQRGHIHGEGLAARDASWLMKLSGRKGHGGLKLADVSKLLDAAIRQFSRNVEIAESGRWSRSATEPAPMWIDLCKTALSIGDIGAAELLFSIPNQSPKAFDLRKTCVPAAGVLHRWSRKKMPANSLTFPLWIHGLRQKLQSATRAKPSPPRDFSRPVVSACNCKQCNQLSAFLRDPDQETTRIAARKELRSHLEQQIASERLDVTHKTDASSSTHALLLTKTTGSYNDAVKQYTSDLKLLAELNALSN